MTKGSNRWASDGLSSLDFDLILNQTRPFPGATGGQELHWLKVSKRSDIFSSHRLRFVLAPELCCESRCAASPQRLPFSLAELRHEMRASFPCLVQESFDEVGFWLITQEDVMSPLPGRAGPGNITAIPHHGMGIPLSEAAASWSLTEVLRESLGKSGQPALIIRAVKASSLRRDVERMLRDVSHQQAPIISACIGIFRLTGKEFKGTEFKHTVKVGSDDCEQRSWTHLSSFKVLSRPRTSTDTPVCIGEAEGTWTARVARQQNCSGTASNLNWIHRENFWIGADEKGPEICVRFKIEDAMKRKWSKWQVERVRDGKGCGEDLQ